jgi:hypothetical protein
MPRSNKEDNTIDLTSLSTDIAALPAEQQERVAGMVARLTAKEGPSAPLDSAAVAAAYEALDDQGKARITAILKRRQGRRP